MLPISLCLLALSACGNGGGPAPAATPPVAAAPVSNTRPAARVEVPPLSEGQIEQSIGCISAKSSLAGKPLTTSLNFLRVIKDKPNNRYATGLVVLGKQVVTVDTQGDFDCV